MQNKILRVDHYVKNKTANEYVKAYTQIYGNRGQNESSTGRISRSPLYKKFILKPIITQGMRFLNPMKMIRLFNNYMPLESNVFTEQDNSRLTPFRIYENVILDNMVKCVERIPEKKKIIIKIELRNSDTSMIKHVISQFWYFNYWLQS